MPQLWNIDAKGPNEKQSPEIARCLESGGVLLLPTDTIYGIHGRALHQRPVARIFAIKGREPEKSLPVLFSSIEQLEELGAILTPEVNQFLRETWPAPLTAILELEQSIPATAGARTIAARVPALEWLRRILAVTGPLASTSANRSGEKPAAVVADVAADIRSQLDGIVDSGPLRSRSSTLVDFTADPPNLVRQGEFVFTQNLWKKVRKTL